MPLFLKALGFALILTAAAAAGFLKSSQLQLRRKKLAKILRSLSALKEKIRLNGGEIDRLLTESFDPDTVRIHNGIVTADERGLLPADIELLRDFFSQLGMSDAEAETARTELVMSLLSRQLAEAEQTCRELCRLYSTLGVLTGIFICIFLM